MIKLTCMTMIIDCHAHILPAMDDGAKDSATSLEMLKASKEQGVDIVIATPHFYGDRDRMENFISRRSASFARLKQRIEEEGEENFPQIKLGAEVAFFRGISAAEGIENLCVEGTRVLLLEMPFAPWTDKVISDVAALVHDRDFKVVLVHIERYLAYKGQEEKLMQLAQIPVTFQVNAESLLGSSFFEKRGSQKLIKWFETGFVQLMGSDCHNLSSRKPNLQNGRDKLSEATLHAIDYNAEYLMINGGR